MLQMNWRRPLVQGVVAALLAGAFGAESVWFVSGTMLLAAEDTAKAAASVEEAIKVLDMRIMELPNGALPSADRQVGAVNFEINADPKTAFQNQKQQFIKLGWKELPGSMAEAMYGSGMFQKAGYVVSVTTSDAGRPDKPGMSRVSLINFGNVRLTSLPVVEGAKSLFANEATAMYVLETKQAEAVDATRKLLLDAGWEPYGSVGSAPDAVMMTFKRNAVQIQAMVSIAPAQDGKTSLMYSAQLLSADIPAPADAKELQYVDQLKTLRFESSDDYGAVAKYYQQTLGKRGWKPTTENFVESQDQFKRPIGLQVFRNAASELLSLDLQTQEGKTLVVVKHLTAAELAAQEQRAKEAAQKLVAENTARRKAEELARKKKEPMPSVDEPDVGALLKNALGNAPAKKTNAVAIPIPDKAKKVDQTSDNVLQIKLAAGTGKSAAETIRVQLAAGGWKIDEDDADLDDSSGNLTFKKGTQQVTLTFVDTGFTDVTMMVIGIGAKLEAAKPDSLPKADGKESESKPARKAKAKKPVPTAADDDSPMPSKKPVEKPKKGIAKLEKLPNEGKLVLGEKTFKLASVVAYEVKVFDEKRIAVFVSEKPIDMKKLTASLKKDGTDDGLFEFQPQVRLQIDREDKVQSMSLWADNASISSNADLKGDVLVEDGRVRGKVTLSKPGEFFDKIYTFDVSFDTEVIPLPAAKE